MRARQRLADWSARMSAHSSGLLCAMRVKSAKPLAASSPVLVAARMLERVRRRRYADDVRQVARPGDLAHRALPGRGAHDLAHRVHSQKPSMRSQAAARRSKSDGRHDDAAAVEQIVRIRELDAHRVVTARHRMRTDVVHARRKQRRATPSTSSAFTLNRRRSRSCRGTRCGAASSSTRRHRRDRRSEDHQFRAGEHRPRDPPKSSITPAGTSRASSGARAARVAEHRAPATPRRLRGERDRTAEQAEARAPRLGSNGAKAGALTRRPAPSACAAPSRRARSPRPCRW